MKLFTLALLFIFSISIVAQTPDAPKNIAAANPATKEVSAELDKQIADIDRQITQLERDVQIYRLLKQNLALTAALEAGLTKKDLESWELSRDEKGKLRWAPITKPTAKPTP
jgi:conjugal transfer/entry exclusion protein